MLIPRANEPRELIGDRSRTLIERFPVTILLGLQLGAMVVVPAVAKRTEPVGLIVGICVVAVAIAAYVELLSQPLFMPRSRARPVSNFAAYAILTVGILAVVVSALGGRGSFDVQLGVASESALAGLAAPFAVWMLFGTALILWLYRNDQVSRRAGIGVIATVSIVSIWEGLSRAILGQSAAFVITVLVLAVFAGLIRLRVIIATLLLIPIIWPPIYDLRDAIRRETTGIMVGVSANAPLERLQLDTQMALVGDLVPRPMGLEATDAISLLRIGLVPGFLDSPNRPALDTGSRMSIALGGSPTNSQSATMLGNLYIFQGWPGIVLLMIVLTCTTGAMVRRNNPWAFAAFGLIYWYAISFNSSYPDMIPKFLQSATSMLVAYALVRFGSRSATRAPRWQPAPSP